MKQEIAEEPRQAKIEAARKAAREAPAPADGFELQKPPYVGNRNNSCPKPKPPQPPNGGGTR